MDIIKIDRSTIRKNENRHLAGYPIMLDSGNDPEVSFSRCFVPDTIDKSLVRPNIQYVDGSMSGYYVGEFVKDVVLDFAQKIKEVGGLVTVSRSEPIIMYSNLADPEYLYEYEPTDLTCGECGSKILNTNLIEGEAVNQDGDDVFFDVCPVCKAGNSFDYEYEDFKKDMIIQQS